MPWSFVSPRRALSILLLIALFGLTACSRVGVAYRNLDLLIPWSLNDYLSMSEQQRSQFDAQLDEHLHWHCVEQLPRYRQWISALRQMAAEPQIEPAELSARFDEAKRSIDEIALRITPSTVQMLRELDDRQVTELARALDEDIRERREKYVDTPLAKQIETRATRMQKRLATWYGPLTAAQKARVRSWSESLGANNSQWIENRALWQQNLKQALAHRNAADFDTRIADLLQRRQQLWTPEYRQVFAHAEAAALQLLLDVHRDSTVKQRQQLQTRLLQLQEEFEKIDCEA